MRINFLPDRSRMLSAACTSFESSPSRTIHFQSPGGHKSEKARYLFIKNSVSSILFSSWHYCWGSHLCWHSSTRSNVFLQVSSAAPSDQYHQQTFFCIEIKHSRIFKWCFTVFNACRITKLILQRCQHSITYSESSKEYSIDRIHKSTTQESSFCIFICLPIYIESILVLLKIDLTRYWSLKWKYIKVLISNINALPALRAQEGSYCQIEDLQSHLCCGGSSHFIDECIYHSLWDHFGNNVSIRYFPPSQFVSYANTIPNITKQGSGCKANLSP